MERQFSSYEALFVIDLDIGDESVKAIIEKFKGMIEQSGKIGASADSLILSTTRTTDTILLSPLMLRQIFLPRSIVLQKSPRVLCAQWCSRQ